MDTEKNARESRLEKHAKRGILLTVSAKEYLRSTGKKVEDYKFQGFHLEASAERISDSLLNYVLYRLPEEAEVVLDYRVKKVITKRGGPDSRTIFYFYGTALIPKPVTPPAD